MIGRKFGRLTVIKEVGRNNRGILFECSCECGNNAVYPGKDLRSGNNKSCGCLRHKMSGTQIYRAWQNMKKRCNDPSNKSYHNYGGRGITYNLKWETFEGFFEDMEEGFEKGLTLDRIDVNGDYEKENCRWVDWVIQANNTTTNHIVKYNGEELTIAELARKYNKDHTLLNNRISNYNWDAERAMKEEPWEMITYKGKTKRVRDFAEEYGMTYYQLKKRLMRGWNLERALTQPLRKSSK